MKKNDSTKPMKQQAKPGMDIRIRNMLASDIPALMRLKNEAGWNQTRNDWKIFIGECPDGCFVATAGGQVVGSATVIRYETDIAWIGMVLVASAFRRMGIATKLMQSCLDAARACAVVKLDATAAGAKVYEKLEFEQEAVLLRMTRESSGSISTPPQASVSSIEAVDLTTVASMDADVIGASRSSLINRLAADTPAAALKIAEGRTIRGFCLGRRGSRYFQLGPIVADTPDTAISLTMAAVNADPGSHLLVDVPENQTRFIEWLRKIGFTESRSFLRMRRFNRRSTGITQDLTNCFAICGPEFG